jgi:hypothetical protein
MARSWWNPFTGNRVIDLTEPKVVTIDDGEGGRLEVTTSALAAYTELNRHSKLSLVEGYPADEQDVTARAVDLLVRRSWQPVDEQGAPTLTTVRAPAVP